MDSTSFKQTCTYIYIFFNVINFNFWFIILALYFLLTLRLKYFRKNKYIWHLRFWQFTEKLCVLPSVEGVVYSYEASDEILSHGTLVNNTLTIFENCEVGYHKAYSHSFRICMGKGKWSSNSKKLCFSKFCIVIQMF